LGQHASNAATIAAISSAGGGARFQVGLIPPATGAERSEAAMAGGMRAKRAKKSGEGRRGFAARPKHLSTRPNGVSEANE